MKEARAWAQAMERKKLIGELNSPEDSITVGEMLESYLDDVASKTDGSRWNTFRIFAFQRDPIAKLQLTKVITHNIQQWVSRRSSLPSERTGEPLKGATVNRELNLMSAAFTYAVGTRKWIKENPCHGVIRQPEGHGRDRDLLAQSEIQAICATAYTTDSDLKAISPRVGACFLFALETGMRSGQILRIRPKDYNPEDRTVFVSAWECQNLAPRRFVWNLTGTKHGSSPRRRVA